MLKHDVRGEGPTVVLLHSGGMSGRQWRKLADKLSPTHRVVLPDLLGSGENPAWRDEEPFHFHRDVEAVGELLATLDASGAPSAHLVGHSYGGLVALTLAARMAPRVLSLSLYDPVAFGVLHASPDAEGLRDLERASKDPVFLDDARGGSTEWFRAFVDYWNGKGSWDAMPEPSRAAFLRVGRKVYYEVRSLIDDQTPASGYAAITAPVLLMTGERSPAAAQRVVTLLAAALKNAAVQTVPGAGHMGPITHAALVNDAIAAHIG